MFSFAHDHDSSEPDSAHSVWDSDREEREDNERKSIHKRLSNEYDSIVNLQDSASSFIYHSSTTHNFLVGGYLREQISSIRENMSTSKLEHIVGMYYEPDHPIFDVNPLEDEKRRICASCFKCATRPGTLQCCSRCKTTWYCNSQCQRTNWRLHKQVCTKRSDCEIQRIDTLSASECADELKEQHRRGSFDSNTSAYLRRIKSEFERSADDSDDVGLAIHQCVPSSIPLGWALKLLSTPGMIDILLNMPLIRRNRIKLYAKYGRPPNRLRQILTESLFDRLESKITSGPTDAYNFAFYTVNLLIQLMRQIVMLDELSLRPLLTLIVKRLLGLYMNPHVLCDCGDALQYLSGGVAGILNNMMSLDEPEEFGDLLAMFSDFGKDSEWHWKRVVMRSSLLACLYQESLEAWRKSTPLGILQTLIPSLSFVDVWSDEVHGSHFLALFVFWLFETARHSYDMEDGDDDDDEESAHVKLCRRAIDMAFGGDATPACMMKYVAYVLKYQVRKQSDQLRWCNSFWKLKPHLCVSDDDFSYQYGPFMYYLYYVHLGEGSKTETVKRPSQVVINAMSNWNPLQYAKVKGDVYKKCVRSAWSKADFVDSLSFSYQLQNSNV